MGSPQSSNVQHTLHCASHCGTFVCVDAVVNTVRRVFSCCNGPRQRLHPCYAAHAAHLYLTRAAELTLHAVSLFVVVVGVHQFGHVRWTPTMHSTDHSTLNATVSGITVVNQSCTERGRFQTCGSIHRTSLQGEK
jgi:hypothetical protein